MKVVFYLWESFFGLILCFPLSKNLTSDDQISSTGTEQPIANLDLENEIDDIELILKKSLKNGNLRSENLKSEYLETPGGKKPLYPNFRQSEFMPKDGGDYFEVPTTNEELEVLNPLGALTMNVDRYGICAVTLLHREFALTAGRCCARIGLKHDELIVTMALTLYWPECPIVRLYYLEEYLKTSRADICLIEMVYMKDRSLFFQKWPPKGLIKPRQEIAEVFEKTSSTRNIHGCFIYGYKSPEFDSHLVVPVNPIFKEECLKFGRYPRIDEFCAITRGKAKTLGPISDGAYCLCDGILVGTLTYDGTLRRQDHQRIFILTRFDIYQSSIYTHMNLWPRTPESIQTTTIEDSTMKKTTPIPENKTTLFGLIKGESSEEATDAWLWVLEIIKLLTIAFLCIIVLGIVIRFARWIVLKLLRKFCKNRCCQWDPDKNKILRTKKTKIVKVHHRVVVPFYMIIVTILMYIFEKQERIPKLINT